MAENDIIVKITTDLSSLKTGMDDLNAKLSKTGAAAGSAGSKLGGMGQAFNLAMKALGVGMLIRELGQMVGKIEEVKTATGTMQAQVQAMFEETLKPGIPFIVDGIEMLSKGLRGLVGVLNLVGGGLGTYMGAIVNILKGDLSDQTIIAELKAAGDQMGKVWDQTVINFEKSENAKPAAVKKTNKEIIKLRQEAYDRERKIIDKQTQEEQDRNRNNRLESISLSNEKNAQEREDAQRLADYKVKLTQDAAQKTKDEYERLYGLVNARVNDFVDTLAKSLNGEKDAWKNWADSIIQEIERVLLKKALLAGLNWLFPGAGFIGGITNMLMGGGKSGGSGSPTIQVFSNDPATVVRVVNGAYGQANAGAQARLAQVVSRGNVANVRR